VYRRGLDFYLDRTMCTVNEINGDPSNIIPDENRAVFKLVDFVNPNDLQLYNWSMGDVFYIHTSSDLTLPTPIHNFIVDTIVIKVTTTHTTQYSSSGIQCPNPLFLSGTTLYSNTSTYSDGANTIA